MKKTLIALMAMASVACGVGTNEFYVPTAGNYFAGDYSFTFTINEDDLISQDGIITGLKGGNVLAVYGNYSTGNYQTNAFVFNVQDGAITLSAGRGELSGIASGTSPITSSTAYTFGTDTAAPDYATSDFELSVGTTYTIVNKTVVSGTNGMQNISIYAGDFTTPLDTIVYKGNMSNGNENSVIATWGNTAYDVIPEPATATLSLLALAGLAARRRRR
ncbi:MAG: PEP-CTERM sorting domain-containing protein [Akkermansia sp.]|nr:PEP-CTERM sorting domain-containing protein [Akkermansia sp.]